MLPDGVPFESLSFLYSPPTHFFDFKFLMENRPFFRPRFFYFDGWDGMGRDGMEWNGMGWDGMGWDWIGLDWNRQVFTVLT